MARISGAASDVEVRATLIAMPEADIVPKLLRGEFKDDQALFDFAKAQVAAGKARIEAAPRVVAPDGKSGYFQNGPLVTAPAEFGFTETEPKRIAMLNFDNYRCGTMLRADPLLRDGIIHLKQEFEHHLTLPTVQKYSASLLDSIEKSDYIIEQKAIYYQRTTQTLHVTPGDVVLASVSRPLELRDGVQECHLLFSQAKTESPANAKSGNIHIQVVAIEAPDTLIRSELDRRGDADELLDRLLDNSSASIHTYSGVTTASGHRAKVELVRQNSYPTELDPEEPHFALPTAFELRPSGNMLDFDAVLSTDHRTIQLNLAPEWVGSMNLNPQHSALLTTGKMGASVQPEFASEKITTQCQLIAKGDVVMIGSMAGKSPNTGQLWFVRGVSTVETKKRSEEKATDQLDISTTVIAVPVEEAAILRLTGEKDDESFYDELLDRVKGGTAQQIYSGSITTLSGQRAKISSGRELIYPAEFDFFGNKEIIAGPTAFDYQKVGFELEVDPVFDNGNISLLFAMELQIAPPEFQLIPVDTKQPQLGLDSLRTYPLSLNTNLRARPGEPILAGVIQPTGEQAMRAGVPKNASLFIFVQANLLNP
jgi:hypothetical protein